MVAAGNVMRIRK